MKNAFHGRINHDTMRTAACGVHIHATIHV